MSATGPAGTLDWRAIAAGAGASIAIGMSASFLMRSALSGGSVDLAYGTLLAINGLVSVIADVVGGATAGLLAKRRGALHGLLAMLLASAFGIVVSVVMLARVGQLALMAGVVYWLQWFGMALVGVAIGTFAGWIAARLAAAKST
jgi:hypothetical protein